jgi:DNA helicase-2/ATP-dependent DNA helicase PcrA
MCIVGYSDAVDYLTSLNNAQKQAVLHTKGPLLILAGAGAGKTRVITTRIVHLMHGGVAPQNILAVTFTNKAAREMKERMHTLLSTQMPHFKAYDQHPCISTFHALCVRILREHGSVVGIPRRFNILDRADSQRILKTAMKEMGVDPKQFSPRIMLSQISKLKGNNTTIAEFKETLEHDAPAHSILIPVWEQYEKRVGNEKSLDFDDLLLRAVRLLTQHSHILGIYHDRFHYIHVDEYQDTNRIQHELMRLLGEKRMNVCVVGDIDQTIYSWRGATIDNILNFERAYPGATVVLLEQNYRSTKTILEASNTIIKKNAQRVEKNLFTENAMGERIALAALSDEMAEAYFVAQKAQSLIESGTAPKSVAVLYRANFQSRALEEAFLALNIPYQVLGVRFFERKEVKDVLSYIRAALNPESMSDIVRIVNTPPRGIGKVTALKFIEGKKLGGTFKEKTDSFKELLGKIAETARTQPPSKTVKHVLTESGLEKEFSNGGEDDLERLENIRELATLATRYDTLSPEEGILALLEDAALATDQDELKEERDAVRLMTVHAAKGLEFDYVFITGLEEGLFPHTGMSGEDRDEEEERRLFYVALTRARKKLFLTLALERTLFGSREITIPSQFITDIDESLLETETSHTVERPVKTIYLE